MERSELSKKGLQERGTIKGGGSRGKHVGTIGKSKGRERASGIAGMRKRRGPR